MKLKMINVGFGDCFLISDNDELLMVDCGTANLSDIEFRLKVKYINDNYFKEATKTHVLVTHFHEDHYKGLKILAETKKNIFDTFYIPYLFIEKDGRPILLELIIFCYTFFNKTHKIFNISKNVLEHIKVAVDLVKNNNIVCLSTWKKFLFSDKCFEVLWPDKSMNMEQPLVSFANMLDYAIPNIEDYQRIRDNLLNNMRKWYEVNSNSDMDLDDKNNIIYEIVNKQRYYLEKLDGFREENASKVNEHDLFKLFEYCGVKTLMRNINSTSIVFHDKTHNFTDEIAVTTDEKTQVDDKGILMTGDITAKIINQKLKDRFLGPYFIVKSPHHGTASHFTKNIPIPKKYFISTGKRTGYGKVSERYNSHSKTDTERVCTSGIEHCELLTSGKICNNFNANCYNNFIEEEF